MKPESRTPDARTSGDREPFTARSLLDAVGEDVLVVNRNYEIIEANDHFLATYGYTREAVVGRHCYEVCHGYAEPCPRHGESCKLQDVFSTGRPQQCHHLHRVADGSEIWVDVRLSPLEESTGEITHLVVASRDVSELVKTEQQLRQAQKLEALGILAGGIAHDFNNILAAIIGYTELALMKADDPEAVKKSLGEVRKAGQRAKELVAHILSFSRKSEGEKKPILISPVVKETVKLMRASLPATIQIRQDIEPDAGTVLADPIQIYQILLNLCTNAADAMQKEGGDLAVALSTIQPDSPDFDSFGELAPRPYLKLSVSDTGEGIGPDAMDRLFDPAYTTKEGAAGTGLGLPMVRRIVRDHGGEIFAESKPGEGSTFQVLLPLTVKPGREQARGVDSLPGGTEHVLFVDDEPELRSLGQQLLSSLGYRVTVSRSAVEALEMFRSTPNQFDLVVTDLTMPRMTGDKLAGELLRIRPDLPIVLCTGFSERITEEEAKKIGVRAFAVKPLKIGELSGIVRRTLDHA